MTILIVGLLIFIGIHALPWSVEGRAGLQQKLSANGYKVAFSIISAIGLGLIIWGKSVAPFEPLWQPITALKPLTICLVWMAFVLLPAAHMKTNIKRITPHPMSWAVICWGVAHLLVNGDLASVLLFGSLTLYAMGAIISANTRGAKTSDAALPLKSDLIVVAAGTTVFIVIAGAHAHLFGYPVF